MGIVVQLIDDVIRSASVVCYGLILFHGDLDPASRSNRFYPRVIRDTHFRITFPSIVFGSMDGDVSRDKHQQGNEDRHPC